VDTIISFFKKLLGSPEVTIAKTVASFENTKTTLLNAATEVLDMQDEVEQEIDALLDRSLELGKSARQAEKLAFNISKLLESN
jgi:hypothetical protein